MRALVRELSLALREHVLPQLGSHAQRAHEGLSEGAGDVTFAIDAGAEELLESFLAERAPGVAFYSEDRGLVEPSGGAETVLVVDPIDGTRPALAGFESCCVSVAAAPHRPGVTLADVEVGCVVEIKSGQVFLAERGAGLVEGPPVRLSANERLDRLFWVYGFRGRPARAMACVLETLIDGCVGGGSFELGSAAYDMTRIATGQLDAYVEPGPRMIEEVPGMEAEFRRAGGGSLLNNTPYDIAAAWLVLREAGAVVTDASGRELDDRPLLGSSGEFQMSVLAASNPRLHERLLAEVDAGVARLAQ